MSKKYYYHPLTIFLHSLSGLKIWIPALSLGMLKNGFNGSGWMFLFFGGVVIVLLGIWSCVKYLFESYTIDADKLVIYEGIIRKKEIEVTYERMQAIKQRQWFFLVPFHVVSLQIETAGGEGKPEVNIPAIPIRVFNEIEHYRQQTSNKQKNSSEQQANQEVTEKDPFHEEQAIKYQLANRQIFLFGITDLSVFMGIFVVLLTIERFVSKKWVNEVENATIMIIQNGGILIVAFGLLFIIVAMVFAMIKSMIAYYHFKVSYFGKTVTIERGLLEKHVQKIPLNKVQGIRIKQNVLRKLLKVTSVELILAGGQEQKENASNAAKVLLIPIISESELYQALQAINVDWQMAKPDIQAVSRGRWVYFSRWSIIVLSPLAVVSFFFYWWLGLILLLLLIFNIAADVLNSHDQGLAFLSESRLCIQNYRFFTKVQTFIDREKVQSIEETSTLFLYRKDLAHLSLRLREGNGCLNVKLRYIKGKDIDRITRFFRTIG